MSGGEEYPLVVVVVDDRGAEHALRLDPLATVRDARRAVQRATGVPPKRQRLFLDGAELECDSALLYELGAEGRRVRLRVRAAWVAPFGGVPMPAELEERMRLAQAGLDAELKPKLAEMGTSGTYFMRAAGRTVAVFKPGDEEPQAPNNPRGHVAELGTVGFKNGVRSGEGYLREIAAYLMDHGGFAGVPPCTLAEVAHASFFRSSDLAATGAGGSVMMLGTPQSVSGSMQLVHHRLLEQQAQNVVEHGASSFFPEGLGLGGGGGGGAAAPAGGTVAARPRTPLSTPRAAEPGAHSDAAAAAAATNVKLGSFQLFERTDGEAGDFGSSKFPVREVHKVGILDIRMCNSDRNDANLLVQTGHADGWRLVPIDHSYAIPDTPEVSWSDWTWLSWRQAKVPFDEETREYVLSLRVEDDIDMLRRVLSVREPCLRVIRVTGMLLKKGVRAGLTLFEIASVMVRQDDETPSELEQICDMAHRFALKEVSAPPRAPARRGSRAAAALPSPAPRRRARSLSPKRRGVQYGGSGGGASPMPSRASPSPRPPRARLLRPSGPPGRPWSAVGDLPDAPVPVLGGGARLRAPVHLVRSRSDATMPGVPAPAAAASTAPLFSVSVAPSAVGYDSDSDESWFDDDDDGGGGGGGGGQEDRERDRDGRSFFASPGDDSSGSDTETDEETLLPAAGLTGEEKWTAQSSTAFIGYLDKLLDQALARAIERRPAAAPSVSCAAPAPGSSPPRPQMSPSMTPFVWARGSPEGDKRSAPSSFDLVPARAPGSVVLSPVPTPGGASMLSAGAALVPQSLTLSAVAPEPPSAMLRAAAASASPSPSPSPKQEEEEHKEEKKEPDEAAAEEPTPGAAGVETLAAPTPVSTQPQRRRKHRRRGRRGGRGRRRRRAEGRQQ